MKNSQGFVRFARGPFRQKWIKGGAIFLAAATLSVGCGKKSEQAASTAPQTNADASSQAISAPGGQAASQPGQPANQPTPSADQPAAAGASAAEPDLSELNRAIRRWLMANRRVPKNFDDFAATAGVPIPPPPAGKKYILTGNMHVQLVNQ